MGVAAKGVAVQKQYEFVRPGTVVNLARDGDATDGALVTAKKQTCYGGTTVGWVWNIGCAKESLHKSQFGKSEGAIGQRRKWNSQ